MWGVELAISAIAVNTTIESSFGNLLNRIKSYNPLIDLDKLNAAYHFGRKAHNGQFRASGDAYFSHPIAVAHLLADMHLDSDTIITALLHDTVEDCDITLQDVAELFGKEIAGLVDGVTKLSRIENQSPDKRQAENFRKLMVAISQDIRVLLVKLADRLHNMQTIESIQSVEKKERIAKETLEIFVPLAERLGITQIQTELEDTSFKILYPEMRVSIQNRLEFLAAESENIFPRICQELQSLISESGIECQVSGRRKSAYSIWRKMQHRQVSMDQLADIMAFRVIVPNILHCYKALGIVHTHYPMVMGRMKDYISTPKRNGYRSIHTGVIGPLNRRIEIQIRTSEMHDLAERGVAAHWDYKTGRSEKSEVSFGWVQELISLIEMNSGADEFLEYTKMDMYSDQVFCFTPRGDLISLPAGATAVDFAFAVHSKVGRHCCGVEINGKNRQLASELNNGDQVLIKTDPHARPKVEWEEFVATGRARSAIRRFIRDEHLAEFSRVGKALLEKEYRFHNVALRKSAIIASLNSFNVSRAEELFAMIAEGKISVSEVMNRLNPELRKSKKINKVSRNSQNNNTKERSDTFNISGMNPGMALHVANCCHPVPGDKIIGILTTGKGLTIHSRECLTLTKYTDEPELWVKVGWKRNDRKSFAGRIKVILLNELGALAALSSIIAQQDGNISYMQITKRTSDFFTLILDVDVVNLAKLKSIITVVRSSEFVESVERIMN